MSISNQEAKEKCPIKRGIMELKDREDCPRYADDCTECDNWIEEQDTVNDKEKGDYPYQGIAPKIRKGLL